MIRRTHSALRYHCITEQWSSEITEEVHHPAVDCNFECHFMYLFPVYIHSGSKGGRVYVYTIKEDENGVLAVELETILTENIKFETSTNFFGKSIQLHGDNMLIGAPHQLLDGQVTLQNAEIPFQQGYHLTITAWMNKLACIE